jgi:hypothetical protein
MTQRDTNRVPNEDQFFEWWNSDEPFVELGSFKKDTPLFWALQGWAACSALERIKMDAVVRQLIDTGTLASNPAGLMQRLNKQAEKNGEEL